MAHDSNETIMIDTEAWEIAFKPYTEHQHANAAFDLARVLMGVKQLLQEKPPDVSQAATVLDEACEVLFPLSEFHAAGYELYRIAIEGRVTRAHENLMESLGIKY